jgi:hypothetical protein
MNLATYTVSVVFACYQYSLINEYLNVLAIQSKYEIIGK